MLCAKASYFNRHTIQKYHYTGYELSCRRSRSACVSRGTCITPRASNFSSTAGTRGVMLQQRQMHIQQQQGSGTTHFDGNMLLELNGNTLSTASGHVIIKHLGNGVFASALQQHSTAQHSAPGLLLDLQSSSPAVSEAVISLGELCGTDFLACSRIKLCWMSPYHASSVAGLPGHMQFLLVQLEAGGPYVTVLPLLPDGCKATLQPARDQVGSGNLLAVHLDSGNPDIKRASWRGAVYIAAGSDPFKLVDAAMAAAAALAGGGQPRWEKQLPDITQWLGWCTWDAFYHGVSAQGILQGLEGFKTADPARVPRWLIIDDGWQRTALDHSVAQQQQQQQHPPVKQKQQQPQQQQQQQQQAGEQGPHSHPLPDAVLSGSSSSSGDDGCYRSSVWVWRKCKKLLEGLQRAVLHAVSAIADRLNWWSLLLACLRTRLLHEPLVRLLKMYNRAASEHSKRLISNEFNAKFSDVTSAALADTSSVASAAAVAGVLTAIKQQYGVRHIYAWHAILGYWSGVAPEAVAAAPAAAAAAAAVPLASGSQGAVMAAVVQMSSKTDVIEAATATAAEAESTNATGAAGSSSSSSSSSMGASVVLPRVSATLSDLEPPCNWSQLVLAGIGLPSSPSTFYEQLHSYLASLGIDGVKVDVQNQLELAGSASGQAGGQALAAQWHEALEASAAKHFPGNQLINCMCHNTNNLYRMRHTALARVSDDFYPKLPASHTTHVAVCAFNSLFMGALVQPDWDMFHSRHPRALLHATARMISGGPVYVSDKPGAHDPNLLARLSLPGGRLLQPLLPGRPTRDCLFLDPCRDGSSLLKVWNRNPCNGVVAVFNVQGSGWSRSRLRFVTHDTSPPTLATVVHPQDVEGLESCLAITSELGNIAGSSSSSVQPTDVVQQGGGNGGGGSAVDRSAVLRHSGSYVVYQDSSTCVKVLRPNSGGQNPNGAGLSVALEAAGSDIITIAPLLQLSTSSSSSSVLFAAVGLVNMLNPGGAIRSIAVVGNDGGSSSGNSSTRRGSGSSSGSWVVTEHDKATHTDADDAAAGNGEGTAAAAAATTPREQQGSTSAASTVAVCISVLGCGQLLLHASREPKHATKDGERVSFGYDSSNGSLVVDIPVANADLGGGKDTIGLEHHLVMEF